MTEWSKMHLKPRKIRNLERSYNICWHRLWYCHQICCLILLWLKIRWVCKHLGIIKEQDLNRDWTKKKKWLWMAGAWLGSFLWFSRWMYRWHTSAVPLSSTFEKWGQVKSGSISCYLENSESLSLSLILSTCYSSFTAPSKLNNISACYWALRLHYMNWTRAINMRIKEIMSAKKRAFIKTVGSICFMPHMANNVWWSSSQFIITHDGSTCSIWYSAVDWKSRRLD